MSTVGFVRSLQPRGVATPSPFLRDIHGRFATHCLEWSRDRGQLHTQSVPGNVLSQDGAGRHRFSGYLVRSSRAGLVAYVGLVAIVASWLALSVSARLPSGSLGPVAWWAGLGLGGMASVAIVSAFVLDRRGRTLVDVVVDDGLDQVTESELRGLRDQAAPGRMLWVFALRGFEPGTGRIAHVGQVRRLTAAGSTFVEHLDTAPHS